MIIPITLLSWEELVLLLKPRDFTTVVFNLFLRPHSS